MTIELEKLPIDKLIAVLMAIESVSTQEFASRLNLSYRLVLGVTRKKAPCPRKLISAISLRYSLDIEWLKTTRNIYNQDLGL